MHSFWSNPNAINKHSQLLFIECELWRFNPTEKHRVPNLDGSAGGSQPPLFLEPPLPHSPCQYGSAPGVLYSQNPKYLVEVSLLPIHSSEHDLEKVTGFTSFVSNELLSPQSLSYSKDYVDVKGFSERIERQSTLDMERIYRLISYFLSCCQSKDCNCSLTALSSNSYIITWDPVKTKLLLNLDLFTSSSSSNSNSNSNSRNSNSNSSSSSSSGSSSSSSSSSSRSLSSSNNDITSHKYSCKNSLRKKLDSIISMSRLIRSSLPEFLPAFEPRSSLELLRILKNIAYSFRISIEDLTNSPDIYASIASVGLPFLICKYMAKVSIILVKKGVMVFGREGNPASEHGDPSQYPQAPSHIRPVVRLRGLPWKTAILDIIAFFNPICQLSESDIAISYNKDGRMTGEAYVMLPSTRAYELSRTFLHGKSMGRRWIEVLPSSIQEFLICLQITSLRRQSQSHCSERLSNRHILRLRGLPWSTTEAEIVQFFVSAGIYDVNASDIFIGITDDERASGEAWVILPSCCDAFEVQGILNGRIIGKRYIEVFVSSFKELTSVKSTYSLKQGSRDGLYITSSSSTTAASTGQAFSRRGELMNFRNHQFHRRN